MSFFKRVVLVVFFIVPMAVSAEHHEKGEKLGPPSDGAKDIPGAVGTFALYPPTSYWVDTDAVDPGEPGCHYGTDADGNPNGRAFAESCREDGLLIESNPSAGVVHAHARDTGHPDLFDCDQWCKGTGHEGGMCKTVPAPEPCNEIDPGMTSAMCACN